MGGTLPNVCYGRSGATTARSCRFRAADIRWLPVSLLLSIALAPEVHAEIYKCTDEHGNVAYLQTPCPIEVVKETAAADDVGVAEVQESEDLTESLPEPQPADANIPSSRRPGEPLEVCKKRYRDQIDEIDAELRASFSPAQTDAYKEELLELTRQLRACG